MYSIRNRGFVQLFLEKNRLHRYKKFIEQGKIDSDDITKDLETIGKMIAQRNQDSFELNQKVKKLTNNVKNIEAAINQGEKQIQTFNTKIERVTQAIEQGEENTQLLNGQIEMIREAIEKGEMDAKTLNNRIETHKEAIEKEENNITTLNQRIGAIDTDVKTIEQAIEQEKIEPIAQLITILESSTQVNHFLKRLSTLENELRTKATSEDISKISKTLENRILHLEGLVRIYEKELFNIEKIKDFSILVKGRNLGYCNILRNNGLKVECNEGKYTDSIQTNSITVRCSKLPQNTGHVIQYILGRHNFEINNWRNNLASCSSTSSIILDVKN